MKHYENFYKHGFEIIDFNPHGVDEILKDISSGIIKENFSLQQKYPKTGDLRPNVIDSTKEIKICETIVERKENVTISLSLKEENIKWENSYAKLHFNDQQTAISTLIDNAINGILYSYKEAYIDYVSIHLIKQSGYQQQVIKIS